MALLVITSTHGVYFVSELKVVCCTAEDTAYSADLRLAQISII